MSRVRDAARTPPATCKGRILGLVIGVPIFLGGTALLNLLVLDAIWPGEAKLFAPVLCTDTHPDAFVVADTHQTSDGQSVEHTVYCVAEDGDAVDAGWARAWFLAWALHTVVVMAVIAALVVRSVLRRRRRPPAHRPGDDDGAGAEPRPADRTGGEPTTLADLIDRDFPHR